MPKLEVGKCATCDAEGATLRPNPFTSEKQCEDCREEKIIGVSDIRAWYKLKDEDLKGLSMKTEPQPAFLGGPDRRWYLVDEVEERADEVEKKREKEKSDKEAKKAEAVKAKEKAKAAAPAKEVKRKRGTDVSTDSGLEGGDGRDGEDVDADKEPEKPVKRGRGRPPKEKTAGKDILAASRKKEVPVSIGDAPVKRGRGRPPKAKVAE